MELKFTKQSLKKKLKLKSKNNEKFLENVLKS